MDKSRLKNSNISLKKESSKILFCNEIWEEIYRYIPIKYFYFRPTCGCNFQFQFHGDKLLVGLCFCNSIDNRHKNFIKNVELSELVDALQDQSRITKMSLSHYYELWYRNNSKILRWYQSVGLYGKKKSHVTQTRMYFPKDQFIQQLKGIQYNIDQYKID